MPFGGEECGHRGPLTRPTSGRDRAAVGEFGEALSQGPGANAWRLLSRCQCRTAQPGALL